MSHARLEFGCDRAAPHGAALVTFGVGTHQGDGCRDLTGAGCVPVRGQVQIEQVRRGVDPADPDASLTGPGIAEVDAMAVDELALAPRASDEQHARSTGLDVFLEAFGQVLAQRLAVEDVAPPAAGDLHQHPCALVGGSAGRGFICRLQGAPGGKRSRIDD